MKFKDDITTRVKDVARDIKDSTVTAYDVKRDEIRETSLHKNASKKLTPEEIARAERAGLVIGVMLLLAVLL